MSAPGLPQLTARTVGEQRRIPRLHSTSTPRLRCSVSPQMFPAKYFAATSGDISELLTSLRGETFPFSKSLAFEKNPRIPENFRSGRKRGGFWGVFRDILSYFIRSKRIKDVVANVFACADGRFRGYLPFSGSAPPIRLVLFEPENVL